MKYRLKSPFLSGTANVSVAVPGSDATVEVRAVDGIVSLEKSDESQAIYEALLREGWLDLTDRLSHKPVAPKSFDRGALLARVMLSPAGNFNGTAFGELTSGEKFTVEVVAGAAVIGDPQILVSLEKEGWKPGPGVYVADLQEAPLSVATPSDETEGSEGSTAGDETPAGSSPTKDDAVGQGGADQASEGPASDAPESEATSEEGSEQGADETEGSEGSEV